MAHVKVLPAEVISRIAAGEVVERPASVVKELVENALDAGATRVEVHLKDGGKTLIHIRDNGSGIQREDLDVLFQRHATSKITCAGDLEKVLSLGFRGEALYSIGAVAEVNVKSRAAGRDEAWEIDVKGGAKDAPRPVAMASQGTEIRVNGLFFNTPARRKFLKSDAAEVEQVLNVLLPYALLYPERQFLLAHNGRTLLDLGPAAGGVERAAKAFNLEARHLMSAQAVRSDEAASLRLILGDINIQRPRRDLQYLFVNGRPVQSRTVLFHVNDVYRLIMPEGVHPAFIVFLDVPPEDVDVNIHPSKREVRIRQEARLGGFLRAQVEQLLMTRGGAKEFTSPMEGLAPDKVIFAPGQGSSLPGITGGHGAFSDEVLPVSAGRSFTGRVQREQQQAFTEFASGVVGEREGSLKDRLLQARFIGTFALKYHLFEVGTSLFVIDQHAAQERILFEKFCCQLKAGAVEVQRLLVPVVLKLTPQEALVFEQLNEKFRSFGFDVTALDGNALFWLMKRRRMLT